MFISAVWSEYKWVPLLMGGIMAAATIISLFVPEIPLEDYINWVTISFWVALAASFGFGVYFSMFVKKWWAGLVAGIAILALIILTLIDILMFGVFPLIPGADISIVSLMSFISVGGVGIVAGKSFSDRKQGFCIPFLQDCTKYDCDKVGKCVKK